MIRILVLFAFCLIAAVAHAGDCPKLQPSDNYRELSTILECQDRRIKALEEAPGLAGASRAGVTPSIAADGVWTPGKCFPYEQNQPFKTTITVEDSKDELALCWRDGIAIAKVGKVDSKTITILDPAGYYIENSRPYEGCEYNKTCTLKLANGKVNFVAQMLMLPGSSRHARLTIESHPF